MSMVGAMITHNLKEILTLKIKTRVDNYADQFTRIFAVKLYLMCSLIMGIGWFQDTVSCMVPGQSDLSWEFVRKACWIKGM